MRFLIFLNLILFPSLCLANTYAKIDMTSPGSGTGTIVNIQLMGPGDIQDPAFTFNDLNGVSPVPEIGWTWDGSVYAFVGQAPDVYGNPVVFSTDGTHDFYVDSGITYSFAAGTSAATVYLALAKKVNLSLMMSAEQVYVESRYATPTRLLFFGLYANANLNGLSNRSLYIAQLFTWQNAGLTYAASYVANVNSQTTPSAVLAITPDFSSLTSSDPLVTPIGAITILN